MKQNNGKESNIISHPTIDDVEIVDILHALGDPVRLQIVRIAARTKTALPCSAFNLNLPKATASRHFQILRDAGILKQTPEGNQRLISLRRKELDKKFPGLLRLVLTSSE
jgi:DNA-binding transcriptional ArsR family regulator